MIKEKEKELLKLNIEFSPKYILISKMFEVYLFFLILIFICFSLKKILYGILTIIMFIFVVIFKVAIEKRKSDMAEMKFYDDRIEFKGKMFFFNVKERILKYDEIKDITFTQGATFFERRFQKAFGYGNIYVYPKKGNFIFNGMQIELVSDIKNKIEEIKKIVGDKIKNG